MTSMHQRLSEMIWEAQGETDQDLANLLCVDAENYARQILDLEPNDAQATYAIALTFYHRWPPAERQDCVEWLLKTEQIDRGFPWVPLYLGYYFFDTERYAESFQQFRRVDRDFFASIDHHWRNLKTDELMLVCQMRGGFEQPVFAVLVEPVTDYINAQQVDRPIPTEIVCATIDSELRSRFNCDSKRVAKEIIRLIVGIGDQNVFANELAQLEATIANVK